MKRKTKKVTQLKAVLNVHEADTILRKYIKDKWYPNRHVMPSRQLLIAGIKSGAVTTNPGKGKWNINSASLVAYARRLQTDKAYLDEMLKVNIDTVRIRRRRGEPRKAMPHGAGAGAWSGNGGPKVEDKQEDAALLNMTNAEHDAAVAAFGDLLLAGDGKAIMEALRRKRKEAEEAVRRSLVLLYDAQTELNRITSFVQMLGGGVR